MPTDIATLGIEIKSSDIKKAVRELDRLETQSKKTETATKKLRNAVNGLGTVLATLGVAALTKSVLNQVNTYQSLSNQLKLVTTDSENLALVQERLFRIADETRNDLEGTTQLYARFARSTQDLGLSQKELADITRTTNQAITVSGATAQESSAAIFQLGQGLSAGALRGQELNSVMEQTPRLARALADGLGVSIGQLREMGAAGELTSKRVVEALQSQTDVIQAEFDQTAVTVSQAMQQIENVVLKTFGEIDSSEFIGALDELKKTIADPAVVSGLQSVGVALLNVAELAVQAASGWGQIFQLIKGGKADVEDLIELTERSSERLGEIGKAPPDELAATDTIAADRKRKEAEMLVEIDQWRKDAIRQIADEEWEETLAIDAERNQIKLDNLSRHLAEGSALELADNNKRRLQDQKLTQAKIGMLGNVAAAAEGFLAATGKQNTKAGKLIFAASKALAIAQSIVNTQVGVTAALAGGPATWPLAPWIKATGYASTALIAATALSGSSGGGGGSVSVPTTTVADTPSVPSLTGTDDQQGGSINITINNPELLSEDSINQLVDGIKDQVENRDVILVSAESRNGQELGVF